MENCVRGTAVADFLCVTRIAKTDGGSIAAFVSKAKVVESARDCGRLHGTSRHS